jgi:hypothetical protein
LKHFLLADVQVLNPTAPAGSAGWERAAFAECASIFVEYDGEPGFNGILPFLGQWIFSVKGCNFAIGCAKNRLGLLRLDGVDVHLEDVGGLSNHSILFADPVDAPSADGDAELADGADNDKDKEPRDKEEAAKKERKPSAMALRRAASSLSVFRGLREGLREGLAAAVGEEVSRAVIDKPYEAHEREKAKALFEDAVRVLGEHVSVGRLVVTAVTVNGVAMTPGGKLRTLSCDGPWEIKEYEGTRSKLLSLAVAGVMSQLLRKQLSLTKQAAAQAAKDALGTRIGQGIGQAKNGAREAAKGAAHEVKEAAMEVRHAASRAREKLMNVSLPMPKLSLVGWSDANSRRSSKDLSSAAKT